MDTESGKWSRALPFDSELFSGEAQINKSTVYVKKLKAEMCAKELEALFQERYGPVKSCKISLDVSHKSRGYGFVLFEDEENAEKCLKGPAPEGMVI